MTYINHIALFFMHWYYGVSDFCFGDESMHFSQNSHSHKEYIWGVKLLPSHRLQLQICLWDIDNLNKWIVVSFKAKGVY